MRIDGVSLPCKLNHQFNHELQRRARIYVQFIHSNKYRKKKLRAAVVAVTAGDAEDVDAAAASNKKSQNISCRKELKKSRFATDFLCTHVFTIIRVKNMKNTFSKSGEPYVVRIDGVFLPRNLNHQFDHEL